MYEQLQRANKYLIKNKATSVAIFDIGTKGVRLLLAPKVVPHRWVKEDFVLIGIEADLGMAFSNTTKTLGVHSKQFKKMLIFIEKHSSNLKKHGVDDIVMTGTAIFRWAENQSEVVDIIKKKTGTEVQVLSAQYEAELSVLGLIPMHTCNGLRAKPQDGDVILMLNQGGGSFEVSWLYWAQRHAQEPQVTVTTFEDLGVNALFKRGGTRAETLAYITESLQQVVLPTSLGQGAKVHIFGMGSALTTAIGKSGFKVHNKTMSKERIDTKLKLWEQKCGEHQAELRAMRDLPKRNSKEVNKLIKKLSDCRSVRVGLPLFKEVLQLCNAESLTVVGTGFIFEYYLARHKVT